MNFKTKSVYAELHTEMQPKESDTLIKIIYRVKRFRSPNTLKEYTLFYTLSRVAYTCTMVTNGTLLLSLRCSSVYIFDFMFVKGCVLLNNN